MVIWNFQNSIGASQTILGAPSPETIDASRKAVRILEEQLQVQQEKLDSIKAKASGLLSSLKIPEEIAKRSYAEAMASVSLRKYWPYFEARREAETQQRITETIHLRLLQEKVDSKIGTEP